MKHCRDCKKWGTIDCPESRECYATINKPFFEPKKEKSLSWRYVRKKVLKCLLIALGISICGELIQHFIGIPKHYVTEFYLVLFLCYTYDYFNQDKQ